MPELIGEDRSPTSGSTPRVRWGTKILTGMITLAGLGGLVMALSYGYDKTNLSRDSSVIPIISADLKNLFVCSADLKILPL